MHGARQPAKKSVLLWREKQPMDAKKWPGAGRQQSGLCLCNACVCGDCVLLLHVESMSETYVWLEMVCYAYSLFCGEVYTEQKCARLTFRRKIIKVWDYPTHFYEKLRSVVCVQRAPENVVSSVFLDVPAGACRARCELDLKHVCI